MKLLSRNYSRKTTVSKLSTQRRANPVQLYSAVGSKAQDPILPVQRLLPLSHHFFVDQLVKGEGWRWRDRGEGKFLCEEGMQLSGQCQYGGKARWDWHDDTPLSSSSAPKRLQGASCRAPRSTVHLPIWPDEGRGDCFIKAKSLRKRKPRRKGWILGITRAFELPREDQTWAAWWH